MAKARAHTLNEIATAAGISRKTVQKAFAVPGAPVRSGSMKEMVKFAKASAPGASKIPGDIAEQDILIKFETRKHRRDKEREWAEEKRLKNLEKKGQLVEREEVRAHGAALGQLLSSTISKWVTDMPAILAGKSTRDMTLTLRDEGDKLIAQIRTAISRATKIKGAKTEDE